MVVRDRDQHASTSLISIPVLSEPCGAKVGFSESSFFDDTPSVIPFRKGFENAFYNQKSAKKLIDFS